MRGITEERLIELELKCSREHDKSLLRTLVFQCQELNPWQPIDENTPQRELLLWSKEYGKCVGHHGTLAVLKLGFTHWQESPEPPK